MRRSLFGRDLKRRPLAKLLDKRATPTRCAVEYVVDRLIHHTNHRLAIHDEADHHHEFTIMGDELSGAIQRVNDPHAPPSQAGKIILRFFCKYAIFGEELSQLLDEKDIRCPIGFGDRLSGIFPAHSWRNLVERPDDGAGVARQTHGSVQFLAKIQFRDGRVVGCVGQSHVILTW